ncbi:MAG: hypothetical protein R2834_23360 [Rhodothermales bacterium]
MNHRTYLSRILLSLVLFAAVATSHAQPHLAMAMPAQSAAPGHTADAPPAPGQFTWVLFDTPERQPADEMATLLEKRGISSHVLSLDANPIRRYRVVHGAYASSDQALTDRQAVTKVVSDAWVMGVTEAMNVASALPAPGIEEPAASPSVDPAPDEPIRRTPLPRRMEADLRFSNVYDSNIDHNDEDTRSYGYVPALHLRLFNAVEDPWITVDYVVARHAYTNSERWDRISNLFSMAFTPHLSGRLRSATTVEASLKGSSEDRDLANQYQVVQEFEYRFTRDHRLFLYGTYRVKRFPDSPEDNALKPNAGLVFQRRMDRGERVEFEARYERNIEALSVSGYSRWTYSAEYRTPITRYGGQAQLKAKYRSKLYDERLVELDDVDYLRQDHNWSMELELNKRVSRNLDLLLGYEYEFRNSNDPSKYFDASLFMLMVSYRL